MEWREAMGVALPISKRARAHMTISQAIKKGTLTRPDKCVRCKNVCKPYAHHNDDANPLEVIWLCSTCHAQKHKELRHQTGVQFKQIYEDSICIAKNMV